MVSPIIDSSYLSKHPFSILSPYRNNLVHLITKMREAVSNLFQYFCDGFSGNSQEINVEVTGVEEVSLVLDPIFWERLDERIHNLHERRRLKLETKCLEIVKISMTKSSYNAPP